MSQAKIAIVGYASRLPQTRDERFWADLQAGRNLITQVAADRWAKPPYWHPDRTHPGTAVTFAAGSLGDVSGFDAGFFGISPREAAAMDPQQRLLLEMSWEALSHAGLRPAALRGRRCGVFIGLASTDYGYRLTDDMASIGPSTATGTTASIAANRLSYFYDWRGPSFVVDTACSSGMVAFHQACQSLLSGESELALAGAISLHLHPYGFVLFSRASMLSASGRSRPFQAGADGYVRSEGGGVFVLKPYADARRDGDRILAVVAHSAINADGYTPGLTIPHVEAQATLLRDTYEAAGIDPDALDYLEAHGTGTAVGDPIELEAIGQALGQARRPGHRLPVGSVKSNLGHLETASAVPSLIKAIHCLQHRSIPPTIGIDTLNPQLPLARYGLEIVSEPHALPTRGPLTLGVNSFGFGGANAHVILQNPPAWRRPGQRHQQRQTPPLEAARPLMLSAASPEGLRQVARDMHEAIAAQRPAEWQASLYQLNFRRQWLAHRALFRVRDRADLLDALESFAEQGKRAQQGEALHAWNAQEPDVKGTVWVFSGNGCQWEGMGAQLLEEPAFSQAIDTIDETFAPLSGYRLRDELQGRLGENRYEFTQFAQPALFALQVGMVQVLRAQGMTASAVVGHSVGEVAAAWACGALSLTDATRIIHVRSREQEKTRHLGQMSAVGASADTLGQWLTDLSLASQIEVAAFNSPSGSTAVGTVAALSRLETFLVENGVPHKRLPVDYPFHGPHMDGLKDALLADLASIRPRPSQIAFLSTVTGTRLDTRELNPGYWWRNVRAPVYFEQACAAAARHGDLFVEFGGHPVLRPYIREVLAEQSRPGRVVETLTRDRQAQREALDETVGQLWIAGAPPLWEPYFPRVLPFVDLPHYPWERQSYWHATTQESARLLSRYPVHPLLGHPVAGQTGQWEQRIDAATLPWLADHRVGDGAIFPAAGYAELMIAAAASIHPAEEGLPTLRIEALEILAPLLVETSASKVVRTACSTNGEIEIRSRTELAADWTVHAKGRVSLHCEAIRSQTTPPALPTAEYTFSRDEHYALTDAAGLHYGDAFRTVVSGAGQAEQIWARLSVDDATSAADYWLHPTRLDGAFQLFIDRFAREEGYAPGWGFVPVRIEQLDFTAQAGPPVEARARLLRRSPQSFLAEVHLLDSEGRLSVTCQGVRMRRLRLQRPESERVRFFQTQLQPLPRQDTASALAMTPIGESVTEALAHDTPCQLYAQEYSPLLSAYLSFEDSVQDAAANAVDQGALWQTLLQDYPNFLTWTLAAGRRRLATHVSTEDGTAGYRQVLQLPDRAVSAALAQTLRDQLAGLPKAARLDVLEVSDAMPALLPRLADEDGGGRLGLFHAHPDGAETDRQDNWRQFPLMEPPDRLPALDLIWAHLDLRDPDKRAALLDLAQNRLRPGGSLIVSGIEPERWWSDLAIDCDGAYHGDWVSALSGRPFERQQAVASDDTQHWSLIARRLEYHAPPTLEADRVLVAPSEHDFRPLADALRSHRQACQSIPLERSTATREALRKVLWQGQTRTVVFCLSQGGPANASPSEQLADACEMLRQTGLWALEQQVTRLDVLLPGAIRTPSDPQELISAGVAAFARTLQNEWPGLNLRIIDADTQSEAVREPLLLELLAPDEEREIHLNAAGQRFVPRIEEKTTLASNEQHTESVRQLTFSTPGQLRHLGWQARPVARPEPLEVEVDVKATGLNFRDVMYTLGLLSDEALENGFSGPTLGLEFAGTIRSVGQAVQDWSVGDRVLGFAAGGFSERLIAPANTIAAIPPEMDFYQAATIPTVFFTAWYALHELARIKPGERLLVHAGAGGVGIAAIQIAQQAGAEVLATAGTPAKRDFLHLIGVENVYDSRTLDFADDVLRDTLREGVDIVLNSLAGEAMRRSLQLLKPFGRFLELGKRDFYADTALGLRPMRNNLSYFGIDADQMLRARPALTRSVFDQCLQGFGDGALYALPHTVFSSPAIVDAFRHMQQSRQIGKVVVDMQGPFLPKQHTAGAYPAKRVSLNPEGVYLITGGASGLGLATAVRLVERGAKKLVLVSRSQPATEAALDTIDGLRQVGAEVALRRCDVSNATQLEALLTDIAPFGALRGVVHAAAVIEDALAENLDRASLAKVLSPKADGAWHLHRLTAQCPLDFFVVYSSISNLLGNVGQAAYTAANGAMEALIRARRAQGLPGTAIQLGPIADTGFLTRNGQTRSALEKRLGGSALSAALALDMLEASLVADCDVLAAAELNWATIRRHLPVTTTLKYAHLDADDEGGDAGLGMSDWQTHLSELDEEAALPILGEWIAHEVGHVMRLPPEKIDPHQRLSDLGFDSLMGMELALALEERLNTKVPTFVLSEEPTIHKLAQRLWRDLLREQPQESGAAPQLAELARQHGVETQDYATVMSAVET